MDGGRFGGIVDSPSRIPKSVYLSPKISSSPFHSTEVNYFCKSPMSGARGRPLPLSPSFSAPLAAMAISNNRALDRHDPNELRDPSFQRPTDRRNLGGVWALFAPEQLDNNYSCPQSKLVRTETPKPESGVKPGSWGQMDVHWPLHWLDLPRTRGQHATVGKRFNAPG